MVGRTCTRTRARATREGIPPFPPPHSDLSRFPTGLCPVQTCAQGQCPSGDRFATPPRSRELFCVVTRWSTIGEGGREKKKEESKEDYRRSKVWKERKGYYFGGREMGWNKRDFCSLEEKRRRRGEVEVGDSLVVGLVFRE